MLSHRPPWRRRSLTSPWVKSVRVLLYFVATLNLKSLCRELFDPKNKQSDRFVLFCGIADLCAAGDLQCGAEFDSDFLRLPIASVANG
jgi:hypothetical protein